MHLSLSAHAKINWSLAVLGRRSDGYHLLDTVMQSIALSDTLTFAPSDALSLSIDGPVALPDGGDNLVLRAAKLLQQACGVSAGASIGLTKRIPVGAGLGGGSADAAQTLVGLNRLWSLSLTEQELSAFALQLGADVPFCLRGGAARAQGIGEVLTPLPPLKMRHLVLVQPEKGLSTPSVFRCYDGQPPAQNPDIEALIAALIGEDEGMLHLTMRNALQPAAILLQPGIRDCLDALLKQGATHAMMTGSGSAVFGLFPDSTSAAIAGERLRNRWDHTYATYTIEESHLV